MKLITAATAVLLLSVSPLFSADVSEVWAKNCASCHGKDGKGETKAGKKAKVKDLTDKAYQATFNDEKMLAQIRDGLKGEDGKERMKPFKGKLTEDEMKAVVSYVRKLAK